MPLRVLQIPKVTVDSHELVLNYDIVILNDTHFM